jgi:Uma2 family endonuclease
MRPPGKLRPPTYADILRLPAHVVGEILEGELVVSPRPASPHARASSILGYKLTGPFDVGDRGPGGWWIIDEPELHLSRDIVVPDLAGWRREKMPRYERVSHFELAPDWVCEVLSPQTSRYDRTKKLRIYARERVSHAWLIDPDARTLEVYELTEGRWVLLSTHVEQEKVRAPPFDAVELELGALWPEEPKKRKPRRPQRKKRR